MDGRGVASTASWPSFPAVARIVVVGSVNLDLVARVPRLPQPGETLAAHELRRVPGGKGANQALAARRLGADVALVAAVGADPAADEALALLRDEGVDLSGVTAHPELPTGHALVTVDDDGETTIVVAAGANDVVAAGELGHADAVLTVLEVPDLAVAAAAARATGMFVLNAAPARPVAPDVLRRADLVVVNRAEFAALDGLDAAAGGGRHARRRGGRAAPRRRGGGPGHAAAHHGRRRHGRGRLLHRGAHGRAAGRSRPTRTRCATPAPRARWPSPGPAPSPRSPRPRNWS